MTKQQIHAICRAIAQTREISIPGREYTLGEDGFKSTQLLPMARIDHLFASEDFRLGWKMAHESLADRISWIMTASHGDLVKYAGRARKETSH